MTPLRWQVYAALAVAIAAIFAVDLGTPLGLGVPFLYLLAVLLAVWKRVEGWVLVSIAFLCTGLAIGKLFHPAAHGVVSLGESNRLIFTVLIWALVGLELIRRRFEARMDAARQKSREDLERLVQERTRELQNEITERKQAERIVQEYADRLRGLAAQLVDAQEAERRNLANELHDRIGQNLSALNIGLSLTRNQLPAEAEGPRARIKDALDLVERTAEMVRGVMEELHPVLLDQYGLEVALRWYGDEYGRRTGIRVINQAPEEFPRLEGRVEIAFFRIAQEALTNVAKHARASRVTVSLAHDSAAVELAIEDDGIGLQPRAPGEQAIGSGWGLAIMDERARSIGANLKISGAPGGGTRVLARVAKGLKEIDGGH